MKLALLGLCLCACAAHRTPWQQYEQAEQSNLEPLLIEAIGFPTVAGNTQARDAEQAFLRRTAASLGLVAREAGKVTEIELPGPAGAPVLGLVVHGDVQPVDEKAWAFPPFSGQLKDEYIVGRGAADDKGPLIQALLAMSALRESGVKLTHTVRLLVGSDEESDNTDIKEYLEKHEAPAYSLVLDSEFPVVVGEKAWQALTVSVPRGAAERPNPYPYVIETLEAGLAPSIVPDKARLVLRWEHGQVDWAPLIEKLKAQKLDEGTRLELHDNGAQLEIIVHGKSAHAGVNLAGGRNALVSLARLVHGELPPGELASLIEFAELGGQDTAGSGLGLAAADPAWPLWGRYAVNLATVSTKTPLAPAQDGNFTLVINLRRPPPMTGPQLRAHFEKVVADFNQRAGAHLIPGGFYADEPLIFDPNAKLVRRLMADYARATGRNDPPAISGGGTYAKRLPRAIAFGMWFPGRPYPGHDVDEKVPVADLHAGVKVLLEALQDLATGPQLNEPFAP